MVKRISNGDELRKGNGSFNSLTLGSRTITDFSLAQQITVAKSSGDYTSIKEAVDSITDSSASKPYVVTIIAGVYAETATITMPDYVALECEGGVLLDASAIVGNVLVLGNNVAISNIRIKDATGIAMIKETAGNIGINSVVFLDCNQCIKLNHVDIIAEIRKINIVTTISTTVKGLEILAGQLTWVDLIVAGIATVTDIVICDGSDTVMTGHNLISLSPNVTNGVSIDNLSRSNLSLINIVGCTGKAIFMDNGVSSIINDAKIFNCDAGMEIGSSSSDTIAYIHGCTFLDSITSNMTVNKGKMYGSGIITNTKNNFISPDFVLYATVNDLFEGDEATRIFGELHVGNPTRPSESVFGEGDSYVQGQLVYTFDGSTYVDVSTAAASVSGSTFTFPNTSVNSAIYWSSKLSISTGLDTVKHSGLKLLVDSAVTYGAGDIVFEYFNGSIWVEFNAMESEGNEPYFPHAKDYFSRTGSIQVRYDIAVANDSWVKNDPMTHGTDYYWVRARIATGITTAPIFQQSKLHSSRTELNSDGWQEYFGNARPTGVLPWDLGLAHPFGASPGNADLFVSDNMGVGRIENLFANGAIDRIGFNSWLPLSLDTSSPIKIRFAVKTDDTSAGNIDWIIRYGYTFDGANVYTSTVSAPTTGPNEQEERQAVAAPIAIDTQQTYEFELDISNMVSRRSGGFGDIIWVTIERTGNSVDDTHTGDVAMINLQAFYTQWCVGGHF